MTALKSNQKKIITDLFKLWNSAAQEALAAILNRGVSLKVQEVLTKPAEGESRLQNTETVLFYPVSITGALKTTLYTAFPEKLLAVMVDIIIGGDGQAPSQEFDNHHFNVLEEVIGQLAAVVQSILSDNLGENVSVNLKKPITSDNGRLADKEMYYVVSKFNIESFPDFEMETWFNPDFAEKMATLFGGYQQNQNNQKSYNNQIKTSGGGKMYRKAEFPGLPDENENNAGAKLDILMDIPLEMTVVLGKTKINFKELVEMGAGSVIELNKLAGEPSEVYVNGRLVGFGEIIVIEENFGVRILETVDNAGTAAAGGM